MANRFYDKGINKIGVSGGILLDTDTIKAVLVDSADYTPNTTTHEFLSDIPSGGRVVTFTLTSKTFGVSGVGALDAANQTATAVTGDPCEYLVYYKDTGSAATSPLIAIVDTAPDLPITPAGVDITLNFNAAGVLAI